MTVHQIADGPTILLDTAKAPLWTLASSIEIVRTARFPRRTIVFGTISDYGGSSSKKYRTAAAEALEAADRVLFVGMNSGRVAQMGRAVPMMLAADEYQISVVVYDPSQTDAPRRLTLAGADSYLLTSVLVTE